MEKLILLEVQKDLKNVFDNKTYDMVLALCLLYFGKSAVKHTDSKIEISSGIYLTLSLSWNETKIYFYSYIGQLDGNTKNPYSQTFRLFTLCEINEYLYMKFLENDFINRNEG